MGDEVMAPFDPMEYVRRQEDASRVRALQDEDRDIALVEPLEPGPEPVLTLPPEFWDGRACLAAIRDFARWRRVAPDAVLGNALVRAAILAPGDFKAYTLGDSDDPTHLGLFAAIVGPSGVGKTSAARAARRMYDMPAADARCDVPLGSGEGMAEAFIDEVEIPPPMDAPARTKPKTERRQTRNRVHFVADEGEAFVKLLARDGATLGATLRAAFTGEPLGNANADPQRRRRVENYTLALAINITPILAPDIAAHSSTGLPQRMLWFSGRDPEAAQYPNRTEVPQLPAPDRDIEFSSRSCPEAWCKSGVLSPVSAGLGLPVH